VVVRVIWIKFGGEKLGGVREEIPQAEEIK